MAKTTEGGIFPSNIRWSELAKPYSLTMQSGRKRPPYSERLLVRAVTMGLDARGNRLHATMPRYHLSHQQAADLVAYVKELDQEHDPDVTDDRSCWEWCFRRNRVAGWC